MTISLSLRILGFWDLLDNFWGRLTCSGDHQPADTAEIFATNTHSENNFSDHRNKMTIRRYDSNGQAQTEGCWHSFFLNTFGFSYKKSSNMAHHKNHKIIKHHKTKIRPTSLRRWFIAAKNIRHVVAAQLRFCPPTKTWRHIFFESWKNNNYSTFHLENVPPNKHLQDLFLGKCFFFVFWCGFSSAFWNFFFP